MQKCLSEKLVTHPHYFLRHYGLMEKNEKMYKLFSFCIVFLVFFIFFELT